MRFADCVGSLGDWAYADDALIIRVVLTGVFATVAGYPIASIGAEQLAGFLFVPNHR